MAMSLLSQLGHGLLSSMTASIQALQNTSVQQEAIVGSLATCEHCLQK